MHFYTKSLYIHIHSDLKSIYRWHILTLQTHVWHNKHAHIYVFYTKTVHHHVQYIYLTGYILSTHTTPYTMYHTYMFHKHINTSTCNIHISYHWCKFIPYNSHVYVPRAPDINTTVFLTDIIQILHIHLLIYICHTIHIVAAITYHKYHT